LNNKRKPLDNAKVRRAISHSLARKAIIEGVNSGYSKPIGSHFPPHDPAYVELTGMYSSDPVKPRSLLMEAGSSNLELSLKLPPPAYARRSGEIIAALLADIGITAKLENVEWAQWLDTAFKNKNFDMTIVSHVEPNDYVKYAEPDYYYQYDNKEV